ncbi:hypothetical protein Tco_0004470 [Tanacetum coccineum]
MLVTSSPCSSPICRISVSAPLFVLSVSTPVSASTGDKESRTALADVSSCGCAEGPGNGYMKKDKSEAKMNKIGHENEMSAKSRGQRYTRISRTNPGPLNGPVKPRWTIPSKRSMVKGRVLDSTVLRN